MLGPAFCANNRGNGTVCLQARARYCENNVLSVAVLADIGGESSLLFRICTRFCFLIGPMLYLPKSCPMPNPRARKALTRFF